MGSTGCTLYACFMKCIAIDVDLGIDSINMQCKINRSSKFLLGLDRYKIDSRIRVINP
jgi:hypothetical protein